MSILENYRREVGHLTEENALDMEFSKLTIDEEVRAVTKELGSRYRGSVRVTHGLFYTDEELEKTRQELLKVKLP
ncbi:hypothetical protein C5S53_04575 [Methanophagales archaeon]|jgi:hypothetical protein|uniref:Uncharacterized protein n=1 Tax=Candidatus Methanophaga sp. ANME-1 ERB7 TaxID=2759913 RepID=A0A7G9Z7B5_9EURY|nr:hypothetical protein POMOPPKL_00009 [Methanosarcinales archaeon ANME-1 ERB7]QNO56149.1 hypothetical protein LBAABJFF_00009 [Methanosarcinales archaeon ANME-1 ERB7]RCV65290.1 hypothetical protein C5S53_04575 [Methanophagales archaeon]